MSLLQFFIIVSAVVFIFLGIDLYKRKKANALHFVIFLSGGAAIILFAFNNQLLNDFWKFFGIARGADLIVYASLIILFYFYFELLNQHTKDKFNLTRLVSQLAINETLNTSKDKISSYKNQTSKDDFIFNIRIYNEGAVIGKTIDEVIAAGFHKILLVNDGSSDNTLEVLTQKQSQYSDKLILIASHTINRGGWAANQTGYNFIKKYGELLNIKRFVGFDADGQMNVQDMETFIKTMHKHPTDMYLGSRFLEGSKVEAMPTARKVILRISKLVTRIFYGSRVSDPHNGYRVISLPALRKINLTADGMHYANELNEQIQRNRIKYVEVPVHIRYTDYSLWKGQKNSNGIKLWIEMIYKKIFFR